MFTTVNLKLVLSLHGIFHKTLQESMIPLVPSCQGLGSSSNHIGCLGHIPSSKFLEVSRDDQVEENYSRFTGYLGV